MSERKTGHYSDFAEVFYVRHAWQNDVTRFMIGASDPYEPEHNDFYYRPRNERYSSDEVFRFLDLPKDVRFLIYELAFGRRIINLGYYHSVYKWNIGRCFFFSAPRMEVGLIEPKNHLDLLSDYQQEMVQSPGFPPPPDAPWLDLSLLSVCKQIYQESREIPFKRNVLAALSGKSYVAFFTRILSPMQTSWVRFLTIILRAEVDGFRSLCHWDDIRARPLPNLISVHFIMRVYNDRSCAYDFGDEGPVWWNSGYDQTPLSLETVHDVPDLFRLLVRSNPNTKFEISVDDTEIRSQVDYLVGNQFSSRPSEKQTFQELMEYYSVTEAHKKIYVEGFRRRLA